MSCTVVVGGQWGDEAKGKFSAYLTVADDCAVSARGGDGPGAGHTVVHEGRECPLRQVPGGFVHAKAKLFLGAGALVGPEVLLREIREYGLDGRMKVDPRASVIEPEHIEQDKTHPHLAGTVQTTGSGHGPAFAARAMRTGKLTRDIEALAPHLADVPAEINAALDAGGSVLIEGTGGYLLSVLYGTYPNVVGKDLTAGTFASDVGVGPRRVTDVVLCFKAFPTRVGPGLFPTEMTDAEASRRGFVEYGTVTKRRRRVGEFDYALAREAARVNHPSYIALSFLDRVDPECRGKRFDQLGATARAFVDRIEAEVNVPVGLLGTGPGTFDVIDRRASIRAHG